MDQWTEIRRKVLVEGASKRSVMAGYRLVRALIARSPSFAVVCPRSHTGPDQLFHFATVHGDSPRSASQAENEGSIPFARSRCFPWSGIRPRDPLSVLLRSIARPSRALLVVSVVSAVVSAVISISFLVVKAVEEFLDRLVPANEFRLTRAG